MPHEELDAFKKFLAGSDGIGYNGANYVKVLHRQDGAARIARARIRQLEGTPVSEDEKAARAFVASFGQFLPFDRRLDLLTTLGAAFAAQIDRLLDEERALCEAETAS